MGFELDDDNWEERGEEWKDGSYSDGIVPEFGFNDDSEYSKNGEEYEELYEDVFKDVEKDLYRLLKKYYPGFFKDGDSCSEDREIVNEIEALLKDYLVGADTFTGFMFQEFDKKLKKIKGITRSARDEILDVLSHDTPGVTLDYALEEAEIDKIPEDKRMEDIRYFLESIYRYLKDEEKLLLILETIEEEINKYGDTETAYKEIETKLQYLESISDEVFSKLTVTKIDVQTILNFLRGENQDFSVDTRLTAKEAMTYYFEKIQKFFKREPYDGKEVVLEEENEALKNTAINTKLKSGLEDISDYIDTFYIENKGLKEKVFRYLEENFINNCYIPSTGFYEGLENLGVDEMVIDFIVQRSSEDVFRSTKPKISVYEAECFMSVFRDLKAYHEKVHQSSYYNKIRHKVSGYLHDNMKPEMSSKDLIKVEIDLAKLGVEKAPLKEMMKIINHLHS